MLKKELISRLKTNVYTHTLFKTTEARVDAIEMLQARGYYFAQNVLDDIDSEHDFNRYPVLAIQKISDDDNAQTEVDVEDVYCFALLSRDYDFTLDYVEMNNVDFMSNLSQIKIYTIYGEKYKESKMFEKVYVEVKNGFAINVDIQNAIDGFEYLGYEIYTFDKENLYARKYDHLFKKYVFIGSIDAMTYILNKAGKNFTHLDYPKSLAKYIERKIIKQTKKEFIDQFQIDNEPKFIKPVRTKLFDGVIFKDMAQMGYLRDVDDNEEIYVSDIIEILSEYRLFVHKGKVIYSANYSGDWSLNVKWTIAQLFASNYKDKPIAFCIDVAILENKRVEIMEISDFWAIAGYGLYCEDYASMLKDRYWEIIND